MKKDSEYIEKSKNVIMAYLENNLMSLEHCQNGIWPKLYWEGNLWD